MSQFRKNLLKELNERITDETMVLVTSTKDTKDEIEYTRGCIKGLRISIEVFEELWEKSFKEDNDTF